MVLIRFGELTLKGRNRSRFEEAVIKVIRRRLKAFPQISFEVSFGRVLLTLNGAEFQDVAKKLDTVFGLNSYSPIERCELEPERIRETAVSMMRNVKKPPSTFKVAVKRTNKKFPLDTLAMNDFVGGYVLSHFPGLKVDVRNPETVLHIEIREKEAFLYCESYPGLGGYPYGTNGKAMLLLSGGIDSPVAGFLALKRGLYVEAVHFHSYPYTSERAQQKVRELVDRLTDYSGGMKLHMVPFTELQTRLKQHVDETGQEKFLITLIRRAMMRIVSRIAANREAKAIVTGESLGQVASQTLPSLTAIERASALPVLRPLIMMDKSEIIRLARTIGTYDISIQPYEDCCTLFVPKSPSTNPNLNIVGLLEGQADWMDALIDDAIARTEMLQIDSRTKRDNNGFF